MTWRCDRILGAGSVWLLAFLFSFLSLCSVFRVQRTGAWTTGHDSSFVTFKRKIDFINIFERRKVEQPKCVFHFKLKHCFNKCFRRSVCACVFSSMSGLIARMLMLFRWFSLSRPVLQGAAILQLACTPWQKLDTSTLPLLISAHSLSSQQWVCSNTICP